MIHIIHYTQAVRLHHAVRNANVEIGQSHVISHYTFPQINVVFCLYLWSILEMTLEMTLYKLRALFHDCMLVTN
jgi:hypothetical protein